MAESKTKAKDNTAKTFGAHEKAAAGSETTQAVQPKSPCMLNM